MAADTFMEWTIIVWLAAAGSIIGLRLVTGEIRMTGLLGAGDIKGRADPERIQLLIGTIAAASYYVSHALAKAAESGQPMTELPELPETAFVLLGGSNILYLTGKLSRLIFAGGK